MAQGGILGNGCKVAYSAASPITWIEVDQVVDITFPTYVADDVNIDTHSTTNKFHRKMAGMITVGDPSFTVLSDMDPSTSVDQAQLRAWNRAGTSVWFRIEVPVNRAKTSFFGIEFQASVKSVEPATPIADKQTTKYNLAFDGVDIYDDLAAGASEIT
jgi:hypothetical protein